MSRIKAALVKWESRLQRIERAAKKVDAKNTLTTLASFSVWLASGKPRGRILAPRLDAVITAALNAPDDPCEVASE